MLSFKYICIFFFTVAFEGCVMNIQTEIPSLERLLSILMNL